MAKRFSSQNDPRQTATEPGPGARLSHWRLHLGFILGPLLFIGLLLIEPPAGFSVAAWRTLALTGLMAVWWVTEALPVAITALLPVALLPLMGVVPMAEAASPYANPLIFLFLGGFILAEGVQRWGLHRRLALWVLAIAGTRPDHVVAGFMIATASLSMWVSNTATAALMLPIGLSVLSLVDTGEQGPKHLNLCLLLGIAMSANIGGMATLIGTPPNALLAGYLRDHHDITLGFAQWMVMALPLSLLLLFMAWWLLTRVLYPVSRHPIQGLGDLLLQQRHDQGPMSGPEKAVAVVFLGVALAWLSRPLLQDFLPGLTLTDPGIALLGALLLFVIPARWQQLQFLMTWEAARNLPWGVLLLVGGGLSLGAAIEASGLALTAAGELQGLAGQPQWLVVAGIVTLVMVLSHVTSNTATAATLLPLAASLALALQLPLLTLLLPVALAASCAFMLPVATPPNAIVFASNQMTVAQMAKAGALISLLAAVLISLWVVLVAGPLLGLF
ncbi:MAG: SLC13/DASS family transporter [Halomonadaceae bacterium]|nr:MAG: SLC13/DASS family transporter [Halomonadaceae bacterium]